MCFLTYQSVVALYLPLRCCLAISQKDKLICALMMHLSLFYSISVYRCKMLFYLKINVVCKMLWSVNERFFVCMSYAYYIL
jgi:hypothetical protein